ncbi:MAG: DNA-formamidopyrimidine glycosylase family protein [Ferruginibacter sp.]
MPEGPSILIMKENLSSITGKKIIKADGYAELDYGRLKNKKVLEIKTWGKHFYICLKDVVIEVHLGLFGSYLLNDRKEKINAKLSLKFAKDELNFYVVNTKLHDNLDDVDWAADVMSDEWDPKAARAKLKEIPGTFICDALMNQHIFSGVGNIIKNESLWRAKIHPLSPVADVAAVSITKLLNEVVKFSYIFLKYRKIGKLDEHLNVYKQEYCSRCGSEIISKTLGKTKRGTYWCSHEQVLPETSKIRTHDKSKKKPVKKR